MGTFWRALVLTLVFGQPAISQSAEETDAWTQAVETGTPEAFFKYLSIYPAGVFVDEAVDALEVLGAIGTRSVGNLNQQTSQQNQQPNQQRIQHRRKALVKESTHERSPAFPSCCRANIDVGGL